MREALIVILSVSEGSITVEGKAVRRYSKRQRRICLILKVILGEKAKQSLIEIR